MVSGTDEPQPFATLVAKRRGPVILVQNWTEELTRLVPNEGKVDVIGPNSGVWPDMATDVSVMLAGAFASNPVHLAAFGHNPLAKNEVFFRTALPLLKGPRFVATDGMQLLGFVHWVDSIRCQVGGLEKVRLLPTMLAGLGGRAT